MITSVAQKLTDLAQIEVRAKLFKKGGLRPMSTPGAQHGHSWLEPERMQFQHRDLWIDISNS